MGEALSIVQRLVDVLLGLTCLGAPFLLWNRSRNAALLGAASGAVYLFAILIDFVLEHVQDGPTPPGVRLAYVLVSGIRNLLFYGYLFGMLMTLARGASGTGARS
jgi:hypothetical protein